MKVYANWYIRLAIALFVIGSVYFNFVAACIMIIALQCIHDYYEFGSGLLRELVYQYRKYSCVRSVGYCAICMETEPLIAGACGHAFGEKCLDKWMERQVRTGHDITCPMCRSVIM